MILKLKNNLMNTKKKTKINSLYIHIPFCDSICPYCDFTKFISKDIFKFGYVNQLIRDLNELIAGNYKFKTIYIGGGTPSCLSIKDLTKLLKKVKLLINFNTNYEFTIEANPESLDENKLRLFKSAGINRISIGIQSFNEKLLETINRNYHINYFNLIKTVKKYINNINIDLIYGLPGQNKDELLKDLNNFIKLDINHISTYSLSINPMSIFYVKGYKEIDEDLSREFYDTILDFLRKHGFERYEVSNFAKPGYESKHNLTYWNDEEYIGLGVGASGYIYPYRYKNSSNLTSYLQGKRNLEKEIITKNDNKIYFLLCNLRKKQGFLLKTYEILFKTRFFDDFSGKIENFLENNLIITENNRVFCSDEGLIKLDLILKEII